MILTSIHSCKPTASETDTSPPVITGCPQSTSYQLPVGATTLPITWVEPRASDNSGVQPRITRSHIPGDNFPVGTTQVIYTFTDQAGNNDVCLFTITVGEYGRLYYQEKNMLMLVLKE